MCFRRGNKQPTPEELIELEKTAQLIGEEALRDEVQPIYYVADDEKLLDKISNDPILEPLLPLYSRLIRMTNCTKEEKEMWQTDIDLIVGTLEADLDEDEYDAGAWAKLQSHAMFLKLAINDSVGGFKLSHVTRFEKMLTIREEKLKKKRFGR